MREQAPDQYRLRMSGHWTNGYTFGMNGAFSIPLKGRGHKVAAFCITSDGTGLPEHDKWEHVSVHCEDYGKDRIPTWVEMCMVKDIFFKPEEWVVQFHPAKDDHINCHPHVLHLWRKVGYEFPHPPKICV